MEKKIIQLMSDEEFKNACTQGFCVVRVSFNPNQRSIALASAKKLSEEDYIHYLEGIGIISDHYDFRWY